MIQYSLCTVSVSVLRTTVFGTTVCVLRGTSSIANPSVGFSGRDKP